MIFILSPGLLLPYYVQSHPDYVIFNLVLFYSLPEHLVHFSGLIRQVDLPFHGLLVLDDVFIFRGHFIEGVPHAFVPQIVFPQGVIPEVWLVLTPVVPTCYSPKTLKTTCRVQPLQLRELP